MQLRPGKLNGCPVQFKVLKIFLCHPLLSQNICMCWCVCMHICVYTQFSFNKDCLSSVAYEASNPYLLSEWKHKIFKDHFKPNVRDYHTEFGGMKVWTGKGDRDSIRKNTTVRCMLNKTSFNLVKGDKGRDAGIVARNFAYLFIFYLKYNWLTLSYWFQVYNIMIQGIYTLWSVHHNKYNYHQSLYKVFMILLTLLTLLRILSLWLLYFITGSRCLLVPLTCFTCSALPPSGHHPFVLCVYEAASFLHLVVCSVF